jgi:hypothetical protein
MQGTVPRQSRCRKQATREKIWLTCQRIHTHECIQASSHTFDAVQGVSLLRADKRGACVKAGVPGAESTWHPKQSAPFQMMRIQRRTFPTRTRTHTPRQAQSKSSCSHEAGKGRPGQGLWANRQQHHRFWEIADNSEPWIACVYARICMCLLLRPESLL